MDLDTPASSRACLQSPATFVGLVAVSSRGGDFELTEHVSKLNSIAPF
jgi:hypothetical protein